MDVGPSPVVLNHQRIGHLSVSNDDGYIQYCLIINIVADIDVVILVNVIFIVIVVKQRHVRCLAFALGNVLRRPVVNVIVVVAPFSQDAAPAAATRGAAAAISSVANGGIDDNDPAAATMSADDVASSIQHAGKREAQ